MPNINLSQYRFTLRDPYHEGDHLGAIEANILNYHRADLIRKIVMKWVTDAERCSEDGVISISELDKLAALIAQFDSQYLFSAREDPRLPAFDHQLRNIAINEVIKLGPSHLIPDFERRVELAMRNPENREKARRQLAGSLKTIFPMEATNV